MYSIKVRDVLAAIPRIDDPGVLEDASSDQAVAAALEMCRPVNWWGTGAGHNLLMAAREEGLPLAWVPARDTIAELSRAEDASARLCILSSRAPSILQDCQGAVDQCTDEWLADDVFLVQRALDAIFAGHHEAAMALAVALGEPLSAWAATPRVLAFDSHADEEEWRRRRRRKYDWAKIEIDRAGEEISPWFFPYQVLIAPIPRFFTTWWSDSNEPQPEGLSRHVVAHRPTPAHFSKANALLAIMLVVSILRQQQHWSEEVRHDDQLDADE